MKRIALFLSVAAIVAMMVAVAAPVAGFAAVQEEKDKMKAEEKDKGKDKMKNEEKDKMKKEEMPKTGGISGGDVALVGLGATALLIGGGLVVRRATR